MPTVTQTEALRWMAQLDTIHAGRLRGVNLDRAAYSYPAVVKSERSWPANYNAALDATEPGDRPVYVVLSDGMPVCWLSANGLLGLADQSLTSQQVRHRDRAAPVLQNLVRHALQRLADARDVREGRPGNTADRNVAQRIGWARVARPDMPTRTWWIPVGTDLGQARARSLKLCGTDEPLILTAHGYGRYGHETHRLNLNWLCAINLGANTDAAALDSNVVGDWLTAEGGPDGGLSAAELPAAFAEAYLGTFSSDWDYATQQLRESGLEQLLRDHDIDIFFNFRGYTERLFRTDVRRISRHRAQGGIVVCRRRS